MKRKMKQWMSLALSMAILLGIAVPAWAANESNDLGVTFQATLDQATIAQSDEDQEVTMRLKANKAIELDGMGLTVVQDDALKLKTIAGGESSIDINTGDYNVANGILGWHVEDGSTITGVTDMLVVTFTVPANTPAGAYTVGVEKIELTENGGDIWETSATASTTLTITDKAAGYTAGLTSTTKAVSVSDKVNVNVDVSHSSDAVFAAGEVKVSYDAAKLQFNKENSTLGNAMVTDKAGVLTLEDYGTDKNLGTGVYVLAFDAIADGEANVTLTSAAFVNKENAVKSDLIDATLTPAELAITISKKTYKVTLPDIFTGPAMVTDGEDYTFTKADGDHYVYDTVTATVNGTTVDVIDNGNGTYMVKNVTGELTITGSRTEKSYSVTFDGNAAGEIKDGAETATYNKNYTFTLPTAERWAYRVDKITIGGKEYTGYTVKDSVYTIAGGAIDGDIVITVSKKQTIASVTVTGTGAGAAAGYDTSATIGQDYTLTLTPEAGYRYQVTATVNGQQVEVEKNGNDYTIRNVTGDVVFNVERIVVVDGVSVSEYLALNGTKMWLVQNKVTLEDGKVPTYDGANMFWSAKYDAYCYLTIAETLDIETAAAYVGIADGTAVNVDYGMDVNMTDKVDASDAQLIYNMYNVVYNGFTEEATAEKFLRADVNGDAIVNVTDAAAVIDHLLA